MAFVALKRLRFGDGYLLPGDEVPIEDGRNYDAALHLGEIAEMDSVAALRAEVDALRKKRGGKDPAPLTDPFVVYVYATIDGNVKCYVYGPTDQQSAEALVPQITERVEGAQCMVLPLEPVPTFEKVGEPDSLDNLSRTELNQLAVDAGVEKPEKLPNKGAVLDALRDATKGDEPADVGSQEG